MKAKIVIEKWYKLLEFPSEFDGEFFTALNSYQIDENSDIKSFDKSCKDGKKNLLSALYFCESAANSLLEKGVPFEIVVETLKDIVVWAKTWSNLKGELYLGELNWLNYHLSGRLFRLGRLQFAFGSAEEDIEKYSVKKGELVVEVHIPEGGKLLIEDCKRSLDLAREFFAKYFPEKPFKVFTCSSWLLDKTLEKYLAPSSNVLNFAILFERVSSKPSNAIIKYVLGWGVTLETLPSVSATGFPERIKQAVLNGETFYETLGVIKK